MKKLLILIVLGLMLVGVVNAASPDPAECQSATVGQKICDSVGVPPLNYWECKWTLIDGYYWDNVGCSSPTPNCKETVAGAATCVDECFTGGSWYSDGYKDCFADDVRQCEEGIWGYYTCNCGTCSSGACSCTGTQTLDCAPGQCGSIEQSCNVLDREEPEPDTCLWQDTTNTCVDCLPEFSTVGILLALLVITIALGFFVFKRKNR